MKKRVEDLIECKFEYETEKLVLSESRLELKVKEGEMVQNYFTLSHPSGKKVKGFLYVSNPRIAADPIQFYGAENRIYYQINMAGLKAGDALECFFTICCDLGEYTIPCHVCVTEKNQQDDTKVNQNTGMSLQELTDRAKEDFGSAYRVYSSADFARELKNTDPQSYLLYQSLARETAREDSDYHRLEEFLVGAGKKETVEIEADITGFILEAPSSSCSESFSIRRKNWGYLELNMSSDCRFLRLEKKHYTTEEFVGNTLQVEYIIDTNFLHAGKNYGRIRIDTSFQTLYLDFEIRKQVWHDESERMIQKQMRKKAEQLYIDFRLKRIDLNTWIERSVKTISTYHRSGGRDIYAELFLIQILYADNKRMKAYQKLQEIETQNERLDTPDKYAFFLYLTTFFQRDVSYVDQVEAKIEQIFLQNRDNWIIQWILMYLQERLLRDDAAKLAAVQEQIMHGCSSPIFYLEGLAIIQRNPFYMHRLGKVETKLLLFAAKEDQLTEEMILQTANLASHMRSFDRQVFEILKAGYRKFPHKDVLSAICSILVNGHCKDHRYFEWYALGVAKELRIAGLYEYYMETMDPETGIEQMPQIIRMYFTYNDTMDYHKKAGIYRNITQNRERIPQIYRSFRSTIEHFTTEQLSLGRIDENLAVLYETYLTKLMLTPSLVEQLVRMMFTFEVTCKNPNMTSVIVSHDHFRTEEEKPLIDGRAQIQIYSEDARVILADRSGKRYADTSLYLAERLMSSFRLMKYCMELAQGHTQLVYYVCGGIHSQADITSRDIPYLKKAVSMDLYTAEYKDELRKMLLNYYVQNPQGEDLYEFLKEISYPEYLKVDKRSLIALLTQEGMYEEAFALIEAYGAEQVLPVHLVRICSQMVLISEYEEKGSLLAYCDQCFNFGKYDDNILNYLLMYYDGPVEEMKRIWNTGRMNELDTLLLEEKILSLLLFTRNGTSGTEPIFASYQKKSGFHKICSAYLHLKCYEYLIQDLPVNRQIFLQIEQNLEKEEPMADLCKLALLRFYSRQIHLTKQQENHVIRLLTECCSRGYRFAFYKKFSKEIRRTFQLDDKVFLEFRADPQHHIVLNYRRKGEQEYRTETMNNCFEGIHVKEFVLFEGEELECFLEEKKEDQILVATDVRVLTKESQQEQPADRYNLINEMIDLAGNGKMKELEQKRENYMQLDQLTEKLFTLI